MTKEEEDREAVQISHDIYAAVISELTKLNEKADGGGYAHDTAFRYCLEAELLRLQLLTPVTSNRALKDKYQSRIEAIRNIQPTVSEKSGKTQISKRATDALEAVALAHRR